MTTFHGLLTSLKLLENLDELQYFEATEIQTKAISVICEGKDLLGIAQTGTGKTASFCLPLIEKLLKRDKLPLGPFALILVPTRELCLQIHENILKFTKGTEIKSTAIYGGVKQIYQAQDINSGVQFVVATPGRLLDLVRKDLITLKSFEVLVLDEADRMLDMGFADDLKLILSGLSQLKQTLLYSATVPTVVKEFSETLLKSPAIIEVAKNSSIPSHITQIVYASELQQKLPLLKKIIMEDAYGSVLVFTNTKKSADDVADYLNKNHMESRAIHSDKKQTEREKSISLFANGKLNILVATDLVARGIDVESVTFVINFDLPLEAESYVHRVGRTGRAEKSGTAISLCSKAESKYLSAIEALIGEKLVSK